jgi:hypothetical protein
MNSPIPKAVGLPISKLPTLPLEPPPPAQTNLLLALIGLRGELDLAGRRILALEQTVEKLEGRK